ncbi:MAG: hypothetical protein K6F79_09720 [Saccharofermentans sp.]|nr:hypothetical protein [Saccharofermentans sp.]
MTRSVTDRIIIFVITLLLLASGTSAAGFSLTEINVVAALLVFCFILCLSLIFKSFIPAAGVSVLAVIVFALGIRSIAIAFAALAYWAMASNARKLLYKLTVPAALTGVSFMLPWQQALVVAALTVLASYMAIVTSRAQQDTTRLLKQYDEAREQMLAERRRRRSATDKSENDIYLATLKERNRIAREIHDNVGHILTRAVVQMKALMVINKDEKLTPYLTSVDESVNTAMTSIRKSVHELHDDSIDLSLGLNDLIKTLPGKFDAKLVTSIESPTGSEFKKTVLGIVKEALTNTAKYSNGDKVRVEVIENNTFWRVFVNDNGKNENKDYTENDFKGAGIGLENIRQRALLAGGNVRIFSDEKGFTVLVTLPKEGRDD